MSTQENDIHAHADAMINTIAYHFKDPVPDVRQMLNKADFTPADECVLVQVFAHGSRALGLDETVNLREPGIETFWAFKSDRIFRFTVDGRGFEWGVAAIAEPMLRTIAHVKDDEVLVFEHEDRPDKVLRPDDEIDLAKSGTEHLRIKKRLVTVFFKNKPYHLPAGVYTTEQLMEKFPIEPGYLLNLKTEDGELVTLKPGKPLEIKNGMHFYSQAPGGSTS